MSTASTLSECLLTCLQGFVSGGFLNVYVDQKFGFGKVSYCSQRLRERALMQSSPGDCFRGHLSDVRLHHHGATPAIRRHCRRLRLHRLRHELHGAHSRLFVFILCSTNVRMLKEMASSVVFPTLLRSWGSCMRRMVRPDSQLSLSRAYLRYLRSRRFHLALLRNVLRDRT